jgi:hypothetical protein
MEEVKEAKEAKEVKERTTKKNATPFRSFTCFTSPTSLLPLCGERIALARPKYYAIEGNVSKVTHGL